MQTYVLNLFSSKSLDFSTRNFYMLSKYIIE